MRAAIRSPMIRLVSSSDAGLAEVIGSSASASEHSRYLSYDLAGFDSSFEIVRYSTDKRSFVVNVGSK